ncbi:MAG: bifunctional phosphoribosylaminoimidazolecarboxamide formyltransferase/IMP cyclohydrolase [Actinomycetota bacterium]
MSGVRPIRRALISVADKTDLVELGRELLSLGVSLVSSGTTARTLQEAGVDVTPVAEVTGFPEMLDGRVKTLHPRIHAGILADRRLPEHGQELKEHDIEPFDLVVSNLYPFRETVASGAAFDDVIENIDIGGPTLVRGAAKNFESVAIVVRPERYTELLEELRRDGGLSRETRLALAEEAFAHTASYDAAIADWFAGRQTDEGLPSFVGLAYDKVRELRYGENPHQRGALYSTGGGPGPFGGAEVLQGKEMSFNNWLDLDAAAGLAADLDATADAASGTAACVIVKHNNPCGAAIAPTLGEAYRRAFASDDVSAFGGIVAFGGEVDADAAQAMEDVFTEVIVAPAYTDGARNAFAARENLRVVRAPLSARPDLDVRPMIGGALVQDADRIVEGRQEMKVVSRREPTEAEWRDLLFAWTVGARVKSNAIVFAKDRATVGVGAGQMSRVDSAVLAARKAGERARGAVMASDAFFPFPDAVEVSADAGITAVIHPGGSVRDEEVLRVAESRDMAVVVTGRRHFRH